MAVSIKRNVSNRFGRITGYLTCRNLTVREKQTIAVTKCDIIPASALTETSISYAEGHTDGRTDSMVSVSPENIRFMGVEKMT